jgi:hypothetical protein
MRAPSSDDLAELYRAWPTERLVRSAFVDAEQYSQQGVELMIAELDARGVTREERETIAAGSVDQERQEERRLTGVGGFLLLFLVILPVNVLVTIAAGLGGLLDADTALAWGFALCQLGLACYGCVVFTLLVRLRPQAPAHARAWLGAAVLVPVGSAAARWLTTGVAPTPSMPALGAALWYAYFLWSRRVVATYRPPGTSAGHEESRRAHAGD